MAATQRTSKLTPYYLIPIIILKNKNLHLLLQFGARCVFVVALCCFVFVFAFSLILYFSSCPHFGAKGAPEVWVCFRRDVALFYVAAADGIFVPNFNRRSCGCCFCHAAPPQNHHNYVHSSRVRRPRFRRRRRVSSRATKQRARGAVLCCCCVLSCISLRLVPSSSGVFYFLVIILDQNMGAGVGDSIGL